jgi:hypothetical protein
MPHPTGGESGPSTWGVCGATELSALAGLAITYCNVWDSLGNEALLRVTVAPGDAFATSIGADFIAGPMYAVGSIADQLGAFTFVSVSAGYGIGAGGSVAVGQGSECGCTVVSDFGGIGVSTPGIGVMIGVSNTEVVAWKVDPTLTGI